MEEYQMRKFRYKVFPKADTFEQTLIIDLEHKISTEKTEILITEPMSICEEEQVAFLSFLLINYIDNFLSKTNSKILSSSEKNFIINEVKEKQKAIIENIRLNFNYEVDDMIEQINNLKEFTDNKFKTLTARVDQT